MSARACKESRKVSPSAACRPSTRTRVKPSLSTPAPRRAFDFSAVGILPPSSIAGSPERQGRLALHGPCPECEEERETASPRPDDTTVPAFREDDPLESWIVGQDTARVKRRPSRSDSERPLRSWVVGGQAAAGINTIVCDGSGGIMVQANGTGNAQQTACLRGCIVAHERSHRSDALAANARICNGIGRGRIVTINTAAERRDTEVRASNVEIRCLRALPDTDACRAIVAARIRQIIAYRDSF